MKLVLALTALLAATTFAQARPLAGSVDQRDLVSAQTTDVYRLVLGADGTTDITVTGDHDTDLDCVLRDENGNLIDSDTDGTDICVLSVNPLWTGPFTLHITNLGFVANLYRLQVR